MKTVTSKDGTTIAYDQWGAGPVIILVDGALQSRAFDQGMAQLASMLAHRYTVIHHDRRGRGDSSDTLPYAVECEIEDIEALIDEVGGPACLYGISSGACLAFEAALALDGRVTRLAMYEAPYNDDSMSKQRWQQYTKELAALLAADRRGDAVALFMMLVGVPAASIDGIRQDPIWPLFEAIAPTLAYDHIALLGEDAGVPVERAARLTMPTLILNGAESYPFMHETAKTLASAIPNAEHRTLAGQTHEVAPEVLAPVLAEFFAMD
ncbi:MAG: alpha/beta hydrolase [Caldilineaceae bacterium]|nr:alpha/beta hydrolase [Caldilineaceae bacterium]